MSESNPWKALAGKFIVLDGPDGCGKTTQMGMLIELVQKEGLKVRRIREPGGTPIGEQVRDLLLSTKNEGMDMRCEMLLYMASRAQLVQEEIRPALAAGEVVIADRYASSTLAYQGGGGGLGWESILQVAEIAVDGVWPDLTIIFDLPTDVAMERMNPLYGKREVKKDQPSLFMVTAFQDRIEQRNRAYFERVRASYLQQAERWPERYRKVDASKSVKQVFAQLLGTIQEFFGV